ncbi:MAG: pseudouridine synthase [Bacteroidota bacterium]
MEHRRRKKQRTNHKKETIKYGPFNPKAINRLQTKETITPSDLGDNVRLNKFVAHCGICSRRKADEHIKNGLIKVNGQVINEPGHRINPNDEVHFKGEKIQIEVRRIYVLMNKPKGTITTSNDDRGRKTVMDLIGTDVSERIFPVGRLDKETTGLLVLTNDGDLAKKLSHPSYNVKKIYHVVLDKPVTKKDLQAIREGLTLEDGFAEVDGVDYVRNKEKNEVGIEIHIGKNRIVRRIFEHLGYEVVKLDRMYYGGLTKKDLPRGRYKFLDEKEIIMLKHFI